MKKFILFSTVILFAAGCSGDGGDKSTGFKVTPGSVTEFTIPDKSHDTSFTAGSSTCAASPSCYSTVFVGTVDGTSYVGIAISDNGNTHDYSGSSSESSSSGRKYTWKHLRCRTCAYVDVA